MLLHRTLPAASQGVRDAERFRLTPSTEFWRTWNPRQDVLSARALAAHALTELMGAGEGGRTSQRYFASHLLRTSAFASLGAAGFLTHAATSAMRMTTPAGPTIAQPTPAALADAGYRALLEALAAYRQDGRRVAAGEYAFPWDMESSRHPQYRGVLRKAARFMFEATQTLRRRRAAEPVTAGCPRTRARCTRYPRKASSLDGKMPCSVSSCRL